MGFLSAYSGVETIDVGNGYWVKVKTCLAAAEKQRAEKALGSPTIDNSGQRSATLSITDFATELVVASILDWNLDDDNGAVWGLAPDAVKRKNIARLPSPVFDQIYEVVNGLNSPQNPADRQRFPDGGVGGDPDGHGGAGVAVELPAGAGAVEAPGAAPVGSGVPAVA